MLTPTAVNGKYPTALLAVLPGFDADGTPHQADLLAVDSYARMSRDLAAAGLGDLLPSPDYSCYRTLAEQQHMVDIGLSTVAPGTSIHGEAKAVDFADLGGFGAPRHAWLTANAARYGWYQPPWAQRYGSNPEPWHWEYDPNTDLHPKPPTPPPTYEEDDDMRVIRSNPAHPTDPGNGSIALIGEAYVGEFGGGDQAGISAAEAVYGPRRELSGRDYATAVDRARSRMKDAR